MMRCRSLLACGLLLALCAPAQATKRDGLEKLIEVVKAEAPSLAPLIDEIASVVRKDKELWPHAFEILTGDVLQRIQRSSKGIKVEAWAHELKNVAGLGRLAETGTSGEIHVRFGNHMKVMRFKFSETDKKVSAAIRLYLNDTLRSTAPGQRQRSTPKARGRIGKIVDAIPISSTRQRYRPDSALERKATTFPNARKDRRLKSW